MRSRNSVMVREFREIFDLPIAIFPQLPDDDSLFLHHKLISEETDELLVAIARHDAHEVLDALGDILYLVYGAALECGYDVDAAMTRIHAANMAKLVDGKVIRREDGKVLKPEGWQPPNLSDLVRPGA